MKKAGFLFIALVVGFAPCIAQGSSPLQFTETEWNFGSIHEEAGPVSHVFEFANTGGTPVAIDRASASCGCTTPDYPKRPFASGETGRLSVTFDPKGYPGGFVKTVSVVSGGGKHRNFLTIKGNVIPSPMTVEQEFPHDMGGGLRFDLVFVAFGQLPQGHPVTATIKYANTADKPVRLAVTPVESSGLLDVEAPESVCAGCRGEVRLTYDLTRNTFYGAAKDLLRVAVDGIASKKTIYTAMTGVDEFTGVGLETAPRLFLDAQAHDFGEVKRRAIPYVFRQTASNEGSRTLHIRSVSSSEGLRCTLKAGMTIAPGAELPFEVLLYADNYYTGALSESIILVVDDPLRPVREIRISAKLK
jgi:hypothetical protein